MLKQKCMYCNKEVEKTKYLFLPQGIVCAECAFKHNLDVPKGFYEKAGFNLNIKNESMETTYNGSVFMKPKDIKKKLDEYVVGQEKAKKIISVAAYNHYKRTLLNDSGIKKSNIMFVGPTGSGKTYLVQTLADILDVPLAIVPATSLTEAGYVGDDVDSVVLRLLREANWNKEKAEKGIIFIDEIDKLTSSSSDVVRQVGGKGVQQALLPILEGAIVSVPIKNKGADLGLAPKTIEIDTTNILFICGGAFPDAEKIIEKRLSGKTNIGFSTMKKTSSSIDKSNLLLEVTSEDLKEFGLIPEILGRLPVVAPLEALNIEALKRILIEPKNSIFKQYQKLFSVDEICLTVEDEALEIIAKKAFYKHTGARSLRSIMEELLLDIMFECPSNDEIGEIIITKEFAQGVGNIQIINRGRNIVCL